ncbi:MAG: UbiA family prenyltransferase [Deltaproteobacteria bacterium]|nr:MAG: UbiA family prenyltransferase [Deltaproteobacteria bacterium]
MTLAEKLPAGREMGHMEGKGALRIFAVVGRFHITVIAALGIFTFGWLFTGEYPWFLTAVCAFDWYFVNLVNRIVDLKEDRANAISGTEFLARNRRLLLGVGFAILLASLVVVHFLNPAITPLRITCHLMGVFYNWPLLPRRRRLKQQYFWKNTASAVGFLFTVFGYPLATLAFEKGFHDFPPGITWATVVFSALFFFLFVLSYEIIYDLRDVRGDALAGIRTYPVVHGERTAIHIVNGLIFSSMVVLAVGYISGFVPWRIFIMACAPALQYVVYKRALRRGISAKDCIAITWMGAVLFFIYHLWVLAELPGVGL